MRMMHVIGMCLVVWFGVAVSCRGVSGDKKQMLPERIQELDLDAPELELLGDAEIVGLLNGYFEEFMLDVSSLERATYVLYNIKSERVRNAYVLPVLFSVLEQRGYTQEVEGLLEDIELCSKTLATIQKSREWKERYYPLREGEKAPDFAMEDERGHWVRLSDFKGKIVFIHVFGEQSEEYVRDFTSFIALQEQYKNRKDVVFLTVFRDSTELKTCRLDFLKEKNYSGEMPHWFINRQKDQFAEEYCMTGSSRYILIDKAGKIVNAWHIPVSHELFSWVFKMELERYD